MRRYRVALSGPPGPGVKITDVCEGGKREMIGAGAHLHKPTHGGDLDAEKIYRVYVTAQDELEACAIALRGEWEKVWTKKENNYVT